MVPVATPDTVPVRDPTVAIAVLPLVHVPPDVGSFSVVVEPIHTPVEPPMLDGSGLTVIFVVEEQPIDVV